MKRFVKILALLLSLTVIGGLLTVCVAAADKEVSAIPFGDYSYTEEFGEEEFEEIFGDGSTAAFSAFVYALGFSLLLFLPSLVVMIVFIVLNSKQKRKLEKYCMIYGDLPPDKNDYRPNPYNPAYFDSNGCNPGSYNPNAYNPNFTTNGTVDFNPQPVPDNRDGTNNATDFSGGDGQ